jgi:hypothetical protein
LKNQNDSENNRKSHFPWHFAMESCTEVRA